MDAEKTNVGLSKDNEQFQHEISELKKQISVLEETNNAAVLEKQALQKEHEDLLKQKDSEIRSLDMQSHKQQTSLDSSIATNNKLILDMNSQSSKLDRYVIDLEKTGVQYEIVTAELKTTKSELKAAHKVAANCEKQVAKLDGQLEVYIKLDGMK